MSQNVSPAQTLALTALLAGQSISEAAEAAGVDRRTVHRWKSEEAFSEALADGQHQIMAECSDRLAGLAERAVEVVEAAIAAQKSHVALRVLDALGLMSRRTIVSVSSPIHTETIPPALSAEEAEDVIRLAKIFSGKPLDPPPPPRDPDPEPEPPPSPPPVLEESDLAGSVFADAIRS